MTSFDVGSENTDKYVDNKPLPSSLTFTLANPQLIAKLTDVLEKNFGFKPGPSEEVKVEGRKVWDRRASKMAFADQLDKIKDQEWYQQIKASYDQLPPDQQQYVKWGGFGAFLLLLFYITYLAMNLANTAKNDYFDKRDLADVVNSAADEVRRLKGQSAGFSQSGAQNWKSIFQGIAAQEGLAPEAIDVTKETPGASQNIIQETLLEVQLKGVTTRALTQVLYSVEHGNPPMKLKGMKIDTNPADGTLTAMLNISGYLPKPEKTDTKGK
jgi:hypothetical protein